ncbi:hypothetical protein GCM10009690_16910 [Brevibacterium permense]|uniref:Uncharacterized protein n=1 Tax=Brevibacterium permense TaxID=234834 RepID=A0ABN2A9R6_9MICO
MNWGGERGEVDHLGAVIRANSVLGSIRDQGGQVERPGLELGREQPGDVTADGTESDEEH